MGRQGRPGGAAAKTHARARREHGHKRKCGREAAGQRGENSAHYTSPEQSPDHTRAVWLLHLSREIDKNH